MYICDSSGVCAKLSCLVRSCAPCVQLCDALSWPLGYAKKCYSSGRHADVDGGQVRPESGVDHFEERALQGLHLEVGREGEVPEQDAGVASTRPRPTSFTNSPSF
ncbi:hypothetical protein GUJ93_ZPchr0010g7824 [Zizania palustris]|uniref:Uncharacterized protein n=1 Tax=Zizania palustris TaxID=103762 RepID=A0A8J6BMB4_ZIZPA|nr:hypothetical protein GUJ93_ZPchr0010g7824 [Zizania palustris]